ncbi:radial spoke head 1 homolog [Agrilus planipennis]|uniref:Radial spoke head 1 homolog n=1 Tax=Agrilus planipennis TaxID=224129 RepID=A0A1W4WZB5_AGRPL|nr:radial spoke head 1 homolog [Agrilus planipennis]
MPKGSKKGKGKGKGGVYPIDETNPNLHFGTGNFQLPNGDKYSGEYCAHKFGIVWREGHGTYFTKEGQSYECQWSKDKIVEGKEITITYPTGEIYHGLTLKDKYEGPGTYYFEHTMPISCIFRGNCPVGHVVLVDLNGRVWEGDTMAKYEGALLLPENALYTQLDEEIGKGQVKRQALLETIQEGEEIEEESAQPSEHTVFMRKDKVENDIDFSASEWCQNYLRFKEMKATVLEKLENDEELTCEESEWHEKYLNFKENAFKRRIQQRPSIDEVDTTLLKQLYNGDNKEKQIPIPTIYAKQLLKYVPVESEKCGEDDCVSTNDLPSIS